MSIIKSPYEISIWRDEIVSGRPREQKICVIGSDKMTSQSRATAPNFTRSANGEKKLSFQMYKQYIDITTGEKVQNPFVDLIANETKIKLYYEGKWHDFIVKDINENSSSHLCSYTLEDALVKELSRNGFGVTLDAALNNNLGDVETLANYALAETDWTVDSEVFVEKVEEALVYLQTKEEIFAVPLLDQTKDADGKYSDGVVEADKESIPEGATILAFYSSCKNKPYRFQFIYNSEGYDRAADGTYKIERKDTRVISQANCQYYIEVSSDNYVDPNADDGTDKLALYLPNTLTIGSTGERWDSITSKLIESDSQISSWYRGERYGYAPQSVYVPMLEKYCQKFKKNDGVEYLHYVESKFISPTLVQNVINNYTFESKNGWYGQSGGKAENTYACYDGSKFKTAIEAFEDGDYDVEQPYKGYMKITTSGNGAILNSGLRDNRTMIKNMPEGEEWILDYTILDEDNLQISDVDFSIGEYAYNPDTGDYVSLLDTKITFEQNVIGPNRIEFKVKSNQYTEDTFKDSSLYLKIQPHYSGTYYIEKIALYRKSLDKQGQIISPDYEYKIEVDEEGNIIDQEISDVAQHFIDTGVVENKYHFFPADQVNPESESCVKTAAELTLTTLDKMDYSIFVPVFNQGAKKIRTISIKESNYFNILQTIAETFESWLDLSIERDADGYITSKTVSFKNYLGEINHANFRYGINLKDVQRTSNSKNIVSKLIVKNNTNELGKDGFCTIQRAGSNPTGENYIYDFQYYHNQNLMDINEYLNTVYYLDDAAGADYDELWLDKSEISEDAPCNLNGYNLRIKKINDTMQPISEEVVGLTQQLVDKQATQEVVKATNSAALTELEKIRTEFKAITGVYPENTSPNSVLGVRKSTKGNWYEKDSNQDWWTVPNANYNPFHLSLDMGTKVVSGDISVTPANYERTARFKIKLEYRCRKYEINDGVDYLYGTYEFISKPTNPFTTGLESSWSIDVSDGFYIDAFTQELSGPFNNIQISYSPYDVLTIDYNGQLAYTSSLTGVSDTHYVGWQGEQFNGSPGTITFDKPFYVNNSNFYNWFLQNTELIREGGALEPPDADIPLWIERTYDMEVMVAPSATKGFFTQKMDVIDTDSRTIQRYLTEYATCLDKERTSTEQLPQLKLKIEALEDSINTRQKTLERLRGYKKQLNHLFFKKYSNFISEGTWIDEKYTDDDKYYADAQSVLYNSCYPQVQYNVNVLFLSKLPGYELFKFELGDKTNVIDDDFFGKDKKQEVVVTEITEMLDDPTQNSIKVQTFKNQFQDLFQKITATTQQTQYNSGSYEKGEKFLEATAAKQSEFITNAINSAQDYLRYGQTVTTGKEGITITDDSDKQSQLRLVGGAILFSTTDPETQEVTWATGLTNEGISASLITAGQLDTGLIQIMSSEGPTFRWDTYGLTAFDAYWSDIDGTRIITDINTSKFVRFDKHGIYGVNNYPGVKGSSWVPKDAAELDRVSTFSLTWDGLKVTGSGNIVAKIGRSNDSIIKITNNNENLLMVTNEGDLKMAGEIIAKGGNIAGFEIGKLDNVPCLYYSAYSEGSLSVLSDSLVLAPKGIIWDGSIGGSPKSLKWKMIVGEKFGITDEGTIYAIGAKLAGEITAEKGKIGGFILEKWYEPSDGYVLRVGGDPTEISTTTESIERDDGTFESVSNRMLNPPEIFFCNVFPAAKLSLGGSLHKNDWRLGIGSNFGVDKSGNVYAKNANLSGHIDATSGTLGGLSINGSITLASGGSIVHNSSSCRWTNEGFSLGTGQVGPWNVKFAGSQGITINYVNGSQNLTTNYATLNDFGIVKNRGTTRIGDSEITWEALFNCIKAPRSGPVSQACIDTLEISNVTITNTTLTGHDSTSVKLGTAWETNQDSLRSIGRFGSYNRSYYLDGSQLRSWDATVGTIKATWDQIIDECKSNNTSDARLKNNIETFNQAYDTFFDALVPTRYQYINGTSGRYHTGFIAQEVVKALELAGLTTQDFAAVMLVEDEEDSYWQLRRDEFVSLNTWQIQLLKPRVAAIEEKISQLEAELAELKSKI